MFTGSELVGSGTPICLARFRAYATVINEIHVLVQFAKVKKFIFRKNR